LAAADRQLERLIHAAGGPDEFFDNYAVIVCSDHSQAPVEERIRLDEAFAEFTIATPGQAGAGGSELALSPAQRSAMVYVLDPDTAADTLARAKQVVGRIEGVDLAMWRDGDEAVIRSRRGELRFAPGGDLADQRDGSWAVDGELSVLRGEVQDGRFLSTEYPDALGRAWAALHCPNAGEILLSAAPGYEFVDWGGSDHVGGGSHGSMHRSDSLGALLWCGTGPESKSDRELWSLRDIAPMIRAHFGVESGPETD
jgi:hypothetical protein